MVDAFDHQEFDNLFGDRKVPRHTKRAPEKHLSTPITYGFYYRLLKDFEQACLESPKAYVLAKTRADYHRFFSEYMVRRVTTDARYRAKHYSSRALDVVLSHVSIPNKRLPRMLNPELYPSLFRIDAQTDRSVSKDVDSALENYSLFQNALEEYIGSEAAFDKISESPLSIAGKLSQETITWFSRYSSWSKVVDWHRALTVQPKTDRVERYQVSHDIRIIRRGDITLIRMNKTRYFVTYEQLQMIQDVCQMRANIYLCLDLNLHNGTSSLRSLVGEIINWQESCLEEYGNEGYEIVKAPEAMYKAQMTKISEGDVFYNTSFDRTLEKIKDKERRLNQVCPMSTKLEAIVSATHNIADCAELFGLIKLSGHPLVNAIESARSVRVEAMSDSNHIPAALRRMTRNIKHIILSNYIKVNQDWPPFKKAPNPESSLGKLHKARVMVLSFDDYNLEDLDYMHFGQFEKFDFSNDYLQFLDDKAICPGASELPKFWFGGSKQETRRLLLAVLQGQGLDMEEIAHKYASGNFDLDDLVVELTQKEREMKIAARCFCKLPLAIRCFFTLTEYNLGEGVMKKYIPQQSMTMSDAETKTRLYQQAKRTADPNNNGVVVEIDFSRWNLRWRHEVVTPVSRILEDIYGFPGVFSQAHNFFSRSTIVMTEPDMVPEGANEKVPIHLWPESDLLWRNHQGGFEGIQQKLWTICTVGMVHSALMDSNCRFLLTGQGDNQVLTLTFPKGADVKNELSRFLGRLETESLMLNHIVKPEECIDSKTVLTYSKDIYVCGVHQQYSLKFASRIMPVADNDIPSLSSEISTACATSVAVAGTLPVPFKALFLQNFNVIRALRYSKRSVSGRNYTHKDIISQILSTPDLLSFFLTLPGSLGGLPVLSWGRYFMRGEVDELSWDIASVIRLSRQIPRLGQDLHLLLRRSYSPKNPDLTQLISDPKSIPIIRPKDNRRLIKDYVKERLPSFTFNPHFSAILKVATGDASSSLLRDLTKMRPLYPNIAKDIYDSSLAGVREALFDRFTMTRTVATLLGEYSFIEEIEQSSEALLRSVIHRYNQAKKFRNRYHDPESTYTYAEKLRSFWDCEGGQIVQSVVCPLSLKLSENIISEPCISATVREHPNTVLSSVGRFPPNFGTKTRQKRTTHGVKIHESSGTIIDLKKVVLISSELKAEGGLRNILDEIVKSRSPWNLDQLESIFPSVYGGTAAHRHDSMQHQFFGVLGNCTPPTHISFSTDNSGPLIGGEDDYPIVFQEFFLFLTNLIQIIGPFCRRPTLALAIIMPKILPVLPNDRVEITGQTETRTWPKVEGNPIASVSTIDIDAITCRPPLTLVKDAELPVAPGTLLLSFLLSTSRIKHGIVDGFSNNVVNVKEFLDIAEFNGVSPTVLIDSVCSFVAIESLYHISRGYNNETLQNALESAIETLLIEYSGPLARLLLSTRGTRERYAKEIGMTSYPGKDGAIAYQHRLKHFLAHRTRILLKDLSWFPSKRFLIFPDSSASGTALLRRISFCWIYYFAQIGGRPIRELKRSVRSEIDLSFLDSEDPSVRVLSFWSNRSTMLRMFGAFLVNFDKSDARSTQIRTAAQHALEVFPAMSYMKLDSTEAIRSLRGRRPMRLIDPIQAPEIIIRKKGSCQINRTHDVFGKSLPPIPMDRTLHERRVDLLIGHLNRSLGRYATAYSLWSALFVHLQLRPTKVLVVGIGHGAIAAAIHTCYNAQTIGIDLREAIPLVPHRDVTWIPPEVEFNGSPELFSLSSLVFSHGGNWYDPCVKELALNDTAVDMCIIDIEDPDLWEKPSEILIPSSSTKYLVRLQASRDELAYFLSMLHAESKVILLSPYRDSRKANWLVIITQLTHCKVVGHYLSVRITPPNCPFLFTCTPDARTAELRIDDVSLPFEMKSRDHRISSLKELSSCVAIARQRVPDIPRVQQRFTRLADALWWIREMDRDVDINVLRALLIAPLDLPTVRLIVLFLSGLQLDYSVMIEDLVFEYLD